MDTGWARLRNADVQNAVATLAAMKAYKSQNDAARVMLSDLSGHRGQDGLSHGLEAQREGHDLLGQSPGQPPPHSQSVMMNPDMFRFGIASGHISSHDVSRSMSNHDAVSRSMSNHDAVSQSMSGHGAVSQSMSGYSMSRPMTGHNAVSRLTGGHDVMSKSGLEWPKTSNGLEHQRSYGGNDVVSSAMTTETLSHLQQVSLHCLLLKYKHLFAAYLFYYLCDVFVEFRRYFNAFIQL